MKLILLFSLICLCNCVRNKDHFHIKLEQDPNRPPRIVENESDPDMVKLKNIQDRFMSVVSNTTLSGDFNSFHQLLSVVDSEAGIELGRLFFNGILIGMGKDNSNQILLEFWEDLQYQLSPDLVEAFKDYKDFIKGMDFKALPAVVDVLFQKDNLGNSLAKMPIGQLVDLVQPEASKYGIDIREFVNGILGKGDSKFPDMVRKLIKNFNATTLLKAATGSIMKDDELLGDKVNKVAKNKRMVKESPLNMFKPFIANALKQNNIDLDVDAVIEVVTPFLDGGSEILTQVLKSFGGKDMNLAQLVPLLGLLGGKSGQEKQPDLMKMAASLLSGANTQKTKDRQPDLMQMAASLLGTNNNQGAPDIASMLKLASTLLGGQKESNSIKKDSLPKESADLDIAGMLKMANSLMGASTKDGQLDLDNIGKIINLVSTATGKDSNSNSFLKMASKLLGSMKNANKPKNHVEERMRELKSDYIEDRKQKEKPSEETLDLSYKDSNLAKSLENLLQEVQKDKKSHHDIKKILKIGNIYMSDKLREAGGLNNLISQIVEAVEAYGSLGIKLNGIQKALSLTESDWADMFGLFEDQSFRDMIRLQSIGPVGSLLRELVSRISSGTYSLPNQARALLFNLGLNDLSVDNFPEKLGPSLEILSSAISLPFSLTTLFVPLQEHLAVLRNWIYDSSIELNKLSKEEMNEVIGNTIDIDVSIPILLIRVAAKASSSHPACLPQAICEASSQMDDDTGVAVFVKKFGSLLYGLYAAQAEDVSLLIEVIRASILNENCLESFPEPCPPFEDGSSVPYEEPEEEQTGEHDEL